MFISVMGAFEWNSVYGVGKTLQEVREKTEAGIRKEIKSGGGRWNRSIRSAVKIDFDWESKKPMIVEEAGGGVERYSLEGLVFHQIEDE